VLDATAREAAVHEGRFSVRDLVVDYGDKRALRVGRLDVRPRAVTALIGPSGCGKSTLLRCFNRMNDEIPEATVRGSLRLDDEEILGRGVDVVALRRQVGMVFQKPNPFPKSIRDNVAYGPRLAGVPRKEQAGIVERALRSAALWDEVKDRLGDSAMSLSGGQQQRLVIARALAVDPRALLLDEPTSALDPIATQHIEQLVKELKERLTIVIVTHNLQQARRIADDTAFFYMGELVEDGPSAELFGAPREERTRRYVEGAFG
jgi:phosphate transport system ATP-binding protein